MRHYFESRWLLSERRLRVATVVLCLVVLGSLVALVAYRSVEDQRPVLARQVDEADRMLEEMQATRDPVALATALADVETRLSTSKGTIPEAQREADLLDSVVSSADRSGVLIVTLQAGDLSEQTIGNRVYRAQRYRVETKGELPSHVRMLVRLETALPPATVIENLIMEPEGDAWLVSFDLVAFARSGMGSP